MKLKFKIFAALMCVALLFCTLQTASLAADGKWIGAWSTSPVESVIEVKGIKLSDFLTKQTVRVFLQPTIDGNRVKFKFSNQFGTAPITISAVNVARKDPATEQGILTDTVIPLTVLRKSTFTVNVGETVYTDFVDMKISALETVAVSYYVSVMEDIRTAGLVGAKAYVALGNQTKTASMDGGVLLESSISGLTYNMIPYLINMDVWTAKGASSIVVIGDSTVANNIPELMAEKFVGSGIRNVGVLQQAICGNRLLYDGVGLLGNIYGPAMIDRFAADALSQKGVKKIFVKIGVNDVLHPRTLSMKDKAPFASVDEIIAGYEQLIEKAHTKGVQIYFFEITSWKGYARELISSGVDLVWSEEAQDICNELNKWIRTNKIADGYIDLSSLNDSADSNKLSDIFTKDGIHFDNLGQVEVVDAIPAALLGFSEDRLVPLKTLLKDKLDEWGQEGGTDPAVDTTIKNPGDSSVKVPQTTAEAYNNYADASSGEAVSETLVQEIIPHDFSSGGEAQNDGLAYNPETNNGTGSSFSKIIITAAVVFAVFLLATGVTVLIIVISSQKNKKKKQAESSQVK